MIVNPFSVIAQKEKVYNASSANLSTLLPEGVSAILISSGTSITDYYTSQTVTLSGNMRGYAVRNGNNIVGWVANYDLSSEYYIGCNLSLHTTWDCIQKNALTSDIPLVNLKRSKVVTGSNIKGFSITIPQVAYRSYVLNIYQRHGYASMLITTNSVGTVDNNTLQNIVSASDLSTSKSGNVVSVTGTSYNYFGVELTMIYQTGIDIDTVINSVTAINA